MPLIHTCKTDPATAAIAATIAAHPHPATPLTAPSRDPNSDPEIQDTPSDLPAGDLPALTDALRQRALDLWPIARQRLYQHCRGTIRYLRAKDQMYQTDDLEQDAWLEWCRLIARDLPPHELWALWSWRLQANGHAITARPPQRLTTIKSVTISTIPHDQLLDGDNIDDPDAAALLEKIHRAAPIIDPAQTIQLKQLLTKLILALDETPDFIRAILARQVDATPDHPAHLDAQERINLCRYRKKLRRRLHHWISQPSSSPGR